jgi:hypothetical protein
MEEINLLREPRVFRANMLNLNRISNNKSSSTELIPSTPGSKTSQLDFANILKKVSSPRHVLASESQVDVDNKFEKVLGSHKPEDMGGPNRQKNLMSESSQLRFNSNTPPKVSRISTDFVRNMYNAIGKA